MAVPGTVRRGLAAVAAIAGVSLAGASAADATTFCVPATNPCVGTAKPTLQAALTAAQADTNARIELQPGEYDGPFSFNGTHHIEIVGSGIDQTLLTSESDSSTFALTASDPTSSISDLTVQNTGVVGTGLQTTIHAVTRVATETTGGIGTSFVFSGGGIASKSQFTSKSNAGAVSLGAGTIADSTATSAQGIAINASDAAAKVLRVRASTTSGSSAVQAPQNLLIEDSVLSGGQSAVLLAIGSTSVTAHHLTINSTGAVPGVEALSVSGGAVAALTLRDSAVLGTTSAGCAGTITNTAVATLTAETIATTGTFAPCPGTPNTGPISITPPTTLITADPKFANAAGGDFRLRFGSPLIDAGTAGALTGTESPTDLAGHPRLVDGNGDGTARRDIGALEYQRVPPVVKASGPRTGKPGASLPFTGSATDADGDAPLTFRWTFDDGTNATTASTTHTFGKSGTHHATLRVTDPSGLSDFQTVTVKISGGATPKVTSLSMSPKSFSPRSSGGSVTKRGGTRVKLKLSVAATVSFTVEKRGKHHKYKRLKGSFKVKAKKGTTRFRFSGRLRSAALASGHYRLRAIAAANGKHSKVKRASFTIH